MIGSEITTRVLQKTKLLSELGIKSGTPDSKAQYAILSLHPSKVSDQCYNLQKQKLIKCKDSLSNDV